MLVLSTEKLCNYIMKLLHTPVRGYDENGVRTMFKGSDHNNDPLICDISFENMLLKKGSVHNPVFYIEKNQSLYTVLKDERNRSYIIGPVCCSDSPAAAAAETVKLHKMNAGICYKMSSVYLENVYECAMMLFEYISDRALTREQMLMQNFDISSLISGVERKKAAINSEFKDHGNMHNPYNQEKREQDSIRTGDIEGLKRSIDESYSGQLGRMAKTRLRSAKNIAIGVITLASRSAIAGGILPELAYSLADAYAQSVEDLNTETEIEVLTRTAEFHYTNLVKEHIDKSRANPIVAASKDYILKHIYKKISLREIAGAVDVNASYLSDLFSKQEGVTLSEYVAGEKINYAKRQLIYTNDPYEAIAVNFSFSSQSHFGRVFKKYTGMTPKEFRERYRAVEVDS